MQSRVSKQTHPESLLNIPLVAQMFDDPNFKIIRRGVDARWNYSEIVSSRMDGFNPLCSAVLIGKNSYIDRWIPHRYGSARKFNSDDKLVGEVMFAVHDYLHAWSYRWINEICPEIGFGTAPITEDNFEKMVFCHLLTEAVATVGLDYWYLSCVDINNIVPIGTTTKGLTVSYDENFYSEYEYFSPNLKVQSPDFFTTIAAFYCDGVFPGFSANDLKLSPVTYRWLKHELKYGKKQREYSRQWFAYLSKGNVKVDQNKLGNPINITESFQRKLMTELGRLLWAKVKNDELVESNFIFPPNSTWQSKLSDVHEYQFVNLNRTRKPSKATEVTMSNDSFDCLLRQYVAQFDFEHFPKEAYEVFSIMKHQRSLKLGHTLFKDFIRVPRSRKEPRDIFLYN